MVGREESRREYARISASADAIERQFAINDIARLQYARQGCLSSYTTVSDDTSTMASSSGAPVTAICGFVGCQASE